MILEATSTGIEILPDPVKLFYGQEECIDDDSPNITKQKKKEHMQHTRTQSSRSASSSSMAVLIHQPESNGLTGPKSSSSSFYDEDNQEKDDSTTKWGLVSLRAKIAMLKCLTRKVARHRDTMLLRQTTNSSRPLSRSLLLYDCCTGNTMLSDPVMVVETKTVKQTLIDPEVHSMSGMEPTTTRSPHRCCVTPSPMPDDEMLFHATCNPKRTTDDDDNDDDYDDTPPVLLLPQPQSPTMLSMDEMMYHTKMSHEPHSPMPEDEMLYHHLYQNHHPANWILPYPRSPMPEDELLYLEKLVHRNSNNNNNICSNEQQVIKDHVNEINDSKNDLEMFMRMEDAQDMTIRSRIEALRRQLSSSSSQQQKLVVGRKETGCNKENRVRWNEDHLMDGTSTVPMPTPALGEEYFPLTPLPAFPPVSIGPYDAAIAYEVLLLRQILEENRTYYVRLRQENQRLQEDIAILQNALERHVQNTNTTTIQHQPTSPPTITNLASNKTDNHHHHHHDTCFNPELEAALQNLVKVKQRNQMLELDLAYANEELAMFQKEFYQQAKQSMTRRMNHPDTTATRAQRNNVSSSCTTNSWNTIPKLKFQTTHHDNQILETIGEYKTTLTTTQTPSRTSNPKMIVSSKLPALDKQLISSDSLPHYHTTTHPSP